MLQAIIHCSGPIAMHERKRNRGGLTGRNDWRLVVGGSLAKAHAAIFERLGMRDVIANGYLQQFRYQVWQYTQEVE